MADNESLQKAIDEYIDTIYDRAAAEFNTIIDNAIEQLKSKRLPRSRTAINRVISETQVERHKEGHYDHLKKKQDKPPIILPAPKTEITSEKTPKHTVLPPGGYMPPDDKEGVSTAINRVKAMEKADNEKWKH